MLLHPPSLSPLSVGTKDFSFEEEEEWVCTDDTRVTWPVRYGI